MSNLPMVEAYADSMGRRAMQEAHLAASQSSLGDLHPDTLVAKNNLGFTLLTLGFLTQARELLEAAWQDCRRIVGKHHPDTLTAMENLALALNNDGECTA